MASDPFDSFINEMLEMLDKKQLSGVTSQVREQLAADLKRRLLDQIDRAVLDAVPEDKLGELERMVDNPDATNEDIQQFIVDSGVDVKRITADAMLRFHDQYVSRH